VAARSSSTASDRLEQADIDGPPCTVKAMLLPLTAALRFPDAELSVPTSEPSVSVNL
jgi:hypothetical protein